MKCSLCNCYNKNVEAYSNYCKKCGLYLGKINKDKVVDTINAMIKRWDSPKSFNWYTKFEDGHVLFRFNVIKKIISNVTIPEDVTLEEFGALIQVLTYLTMDFEYNITTQMIILFALASDFTAEYTSQYRYWIKIGKKEKNRTAYEYSMYELYNIGTRRAKKKIQRIKKLLRRLPNNA